MLLNKEEILQYNMNNFQKLQPRQRVLLVEDNLINQEYMPVILKSLKIKVDVANDNLEALTILTRSQPSTFDLILMDCQMPNLDGYEATLRIRAGEVGDEFRKIPIAALTANTMNVKNALL